MKDTLCRKWARMYLLDMGINELIFLKYRTYSTSEESPRGMNSIANYLTVHKQAQVNRISYIHTLCDFLAFNQSVFSEFTPQYRFRNNR